VAGPFRSCYRVPARRRRCERPTGGQERNIVEIVIALVIYAIIWTVVIFGSEYMNKNVQ
jgi:hypothetical protein